MLRASLSSPFELLKFLSPTPPSPTMIARSSASTRIHPSRGCSSSLFTWGLPRFNLKYHVVLPEKHTEEKKERNMKGTEWNYIRYKNLRLGENSCTFGGSRSWASEGYFKRFSETAFLNHCTIPRRVMMGFRLEIFSWWCEILKIARISVASSSFAKCQWRHSRTWVGSTIGRKIIYFTHREYQVEWFLAKPKETSTRLFPFLLCVSEERRRRK